MDDLPQLSVKSRQPRLMIIIDLVSDVLQRPEFFFYFGSVLIRSPDSLFLPDSCDRNTLLKAEAPLGIQSFFWIFKQEASICEEEPRDGITSQCFV